MSVHNSGRSSELTGSGEGTTQPRHTSLERQDVAMEGPGLGLEKKGAFKKGVCQVPGCGEDLSQLKGYYLRYKICVPHTKLPNMVQNGVTVRWCQQCGRFHSIDAFDGSNRTCRKRLTMQNERRNAKSRAQDEEQQQHQREDEDEVEGGAGMASASAHSRSSARARAAAAAAAQADAVQRKQPSRAAKAALAAADLQGQGVPDQASDAEDEEMGEPWQWQGPSPHEGPAALGAAAGVGAGGMGPGGKEEALHQMQQVQQALGLHERPPLLHQALQQQAALAGQQADSSPAGILQRLKQGFIPAVDAANGQQAHEAGNGMGTVTLKAEPTEQPPGGAVPMDMDVDQVMVNAWATQPGGAVSARGGAAGSMQQGLPESLQSPQLPPPPPLQLDPSQHQQQPASGAADVADFAMQAAGQQGVLPALNLDGNRGAPPESGAERDSQRMDFGGLIAQLGGPQVYALRDMAAAQVLLQLQPSALNFSSTGALNLGSNPSSQGTHVLVGSEGGEGGGGGGSGGGGAMRKRVGSGGVVSEVATRLAGLPFDSSGSLSQQAGGSAGPGGQPKANGEAGPKPGSGTISHTQQVIHPPPPPLGHQSTPNISQALSQHGGSQVGMMPAGLQGQLLCMGGGLGSGGSGAAGAGAGAGLTVLATLPTSDGQNSGSLGTHVLLDPQSLAALLRVTNGQGAPVTVSMLPQGTSTTTPLGVQSSTVSAPVSAPASHQQPANFTLPLSATGSAPGGTSTSSRPTSSEQGNNTHLMPPIFLSNSTEFSDLTELSFPGTNVLPFASWEVLQALLAGSAAAGTSPAAAAAAAGNPAASPAPPTGPASASGPAHTSAPNSFALPGHSAVQAAVAAGASASTPMGSCLPFVMPTAGGSSPASLAMHNLGGNNGSKGSISMPVSLNGGAGGGSATASDVGAAAAATANWAEAAVVQLHQKQQELAVQQAQLVALTSQLQQQLEVQRQAAEMVALAAKQAQQLEDQRKALAAQEAELAAQRMALAAQQEELKRAKHEVEMEREANRMEAVRSHGPNPPHSGAAPAPGAPAASAAAAAAPAQSSGAAPAPSPAPRPATGGLAAIAAAIAAMPGQPEGLQPSLFAGAGAAAGAAQEQEPPGALGPEAEYGRSRPQGVNYGPLLQQLKKLRQGPGGEAAAHAQQGCGSSGGSLGGSVAGGGVAAAGVAGNPAGFAGTNSSSGETASARGPAFGSFGSDGGASNSTTTGLMSQGVVIGSLESLGLGPGTHATSALLQALLTQQPQLQQQHQQQLQLQLQHQQQQQQAAVQGLPTGLVHLPPAPQLLPPQQQQQLLQAAAQPAGTSNNGHVATGPSLLRSLISGRAVSRASSQNPSGAGGLTADHLLQPQPMDTTGPPALLHTWPDAAGGGGGGGDGPPAMLQL